MWVVLFNHLFLVSDNLATADVRRFDAKAIPFDGPTGIVTRVETLLDSAPGMSVREKQDLMDSFIRLILQNS
jgi:hypothetical protein